MKIVVSGGWSYGNIGDEAIAAATIHLVNRYFPEVAVVYTSYDPEDFQKNHGIGAVPSLHKALAGYNNDVSALETLLTKDSSLLRDFSGLVDADTLFIMSGGGYFHENWTTQFYTRLLEIQLAKKAGAKVALIGQSIGPIFTDHGRQLLAQALNLCDYLCVRDNSTAQLLQQLQLQVRIHQAPDVAMITRDIFPACAPEGKPIVNIMPAAFSSYVPNTARKAPHPLAQKIKKRLSFTGINYARQFKKLVRKLVKENRYRVRFVLSTTWQWDRKFADSLTRGLPRDSYEIIPCKTFEQLCSSLSQGSAIISTKMHPLIVSVSYGIVPVGISYNYKVDDFMVMVGCGKQCFRNHALSAEKLLQALSGKAPDPADHIDRVYKSFAQLAEAVGGCHE